MHCSHIRWLSRSQLPIHDAVLTGSWPIAQRAHANFIENQPSFLGALAIAGLRFPMASAVLGATWVFGRLAYAIGYTSSAGPKGRVFGFLVSGLSDNVLRLMAMYASVMYVMEQ